MKVWIVFEYDDYTTDRIIGVYDNKEKATEVHKECPVWRYIKEYEVESKKHMENCIVPNDTKVRLADGRICVIDGNDSEVSERFEDICYFVCPIEYTNEEYWSDYYEYVLRSDFEIVED